MIEEYLNQRLDLLTDQKKQLKNDLMEFRSSLHETKRELDDYVSSTSRPFEPFNPRRYSNEDEHLMSMSEKIKTLNKNFEDVSAQLSSVESEIDTVNKCMDEYYSDHQGHNL